MRSSYLIPLLVWLAVFLPARQTWAHKVNLFAYVDGDTVYTESYFPDGSPVKGGTIEVLDDAGTVLLTGRTDEQGLFSFTLPAGVDLNIVINASMGHKNSYVLKKSEQ